MHQILLITKALSDRNRIRALMFLRGGELCVCQIIEMLGLAPSTVSKHMAILHHAGLVDTRKAGRWMYYRLPGDNAPPSVREAIEWLTRALNTDRQARDDARRLKSVRRMSLEELCRTYKS